VDGRRAEREDTRRWDEENQLKDGRFDLDIFRAEQDARTDDVKAQQAAAALGITVEELRERARHNRNQEQLAYRGQDVQRRGQDVQKYGIDSTNRRHTTPSGDTVYSQSQQNYRHTTPSASSAKPAGIGSKYVETFPKVDPVPGEDGWFSDTPAVPGKPQRRVEQNVLPVPASRAELQPGGIYQTAKGLGRWNGSTFERVQ
jgi:hypothetical protein